MYTAAAAAGKWLRWRWRFARESSCCCFSAAFLCPCIPIIYLSPSVWLGRSRRGGCPVPRLLAWPGFVSSTESASTRQANAAAACGICTHTAERSDGYDGDDGQRHCCCCAFLCSLGMMVWSARVVAGGGSFGFSITSSSSFVSGLPAAALAGFVFLLSNMWRRRWPRHFLV